MSDERPIHLSTGLPETVLPAPDPGVAASLAAAEQEADVDQRRRLVAAVVADQPRLLQGWAALGHLARDPIEAYAYFRVGYHRGLDALRAAGWRGSGYVRWREEANLGFLQSLEGLRAAAAAIGEDDEASRCALFLQQLDPTSPPPSR